MWQEPDGDPRPGPCEGALQPLPWHQRELHRAAQVRSGSSCEGVVMLTPLCLPRDGSLLGIAPGGAREAYFGDSNYPILWGSRWVSLSHQSKHPKIYRQGFAKCAIDAGVPIIPIFTENIREATLCLSGRMNVGRGLWEYLYETTKMPLVPMYGLFPVKLRTHLGKPIYPTPGWFPLSRSFLRAHVISGMKPEEMVALTSNAVQEMIDQHQQLPGSVKRVSSYIIIQIFISTWETGIC